VRHICIIIPDIVPSPSTLFTYEVNFQVSTNSIARVDLEVDRNLYHSHDAIFLVLQMK